MYVNYFVLLKTRLAVWVNSVTGKAEVNQVYTCAIS